MKKKETMIILFLLFLSPALGELLSASCPPLKFFHPPMFVILVVFYGCGTLLIREARARWKLQWAVIFLAVAYGIVEEGVMMQSFFSPHHEGLGNLSGYGMYFGVQWPWTIGLTFYHATVSTIIPIVIIELLWPKYKYAPLLKKRGLLLAFAGITAVTILVMISVWEKEKGKADPYRPDPALLVGSVLVVALLVFLAHRYRKSKVSIRRIHLFSPLLFGACAFLFQTFNLLIGYTLAVNDVSAKIAIGVQLAAMALMLLFVFFQIFHQNATKRHLVSLVLGALLLFILLSPLHEFAPGFNQDPTRGMLLVGIAALILLIIWRRRVLKADCPEIIEINSTK